MNISILGSGSSGNSTFVEIEDYKLLVDTGLVGSEMCIRDRVSVVKKLKKNWK